MGVHFLVSSITLIHGPFTQGFEYMILAGAFGVKPARICPMKTP